MVEKNRVKEMPKTYTISKAQSEEIAMVRKEVKDKRVDKRLQAVQLRGEGMKNAAIASKLDVREKRVSFWVSQLSDMG